MTSAEMGPLDLFMSFLLISPSLTKLGAAANVVCPLEDYVLTGVEFSDCQRETLAEFNPVDSDGYNPCPELERIVSNCAKVLQRCFDERGWERGKQVFLDLLALQFPKHNQCDVFLQRNDPKVPQQLPEEKCSIVEEVSLLTQMRLCNNQAQTAVVDRITHHKMASHPDLYQLLEYGHQELCKGLKNVSDTCFEPNLGSCYDQHDAHFHYVYMLEELKLAGTLLSMHLLSNDTFMNVMKCPVFQQDSPFDGNKKDHYLVLALSLILSFVLVALFVLSGAYIARKYRLGHRLVAWLQNEPYADFEPNPSEMTEVQIEDQRSARAVAQEPLPAIQDLKNNSTATASSFVSLRDQIEEGGQST